jgi:hypothetical protein
VHADAGDGIERVLEPASGAIDAVAAPADRISRASCGHHFCWHCAIRQAAGRKVKDVI